MNHPLGTRDRASPEADATAHGDRSGAQLQPATRHPCLRTLSWRFECRGIRWCVLDDGPLPGPRGGILRVLVEAVDLERAEHAVRAATGIVVPSSIGPHRRTWLFRDAGSGTTLILHVTTRLRVDLGDEVSQRLVRGVFLHRAGGSVPRVGGAERFWLQLLRARGPSSWSAAEWHRLQSAARALPVAASPLAEIVAEALGGDRTVQDVLHELEHRRHLLHHGSQATRPRRRAPARRRRAATIHRSRRLGVTVAVLGPHGRNRASLEHLSDWPFPVHVADAGLVLSDSTSSPGRLVLDLLRVRWQLHRWQTLSRDGALVLVDHHPYEMLAAPARGEAGSQFVRRLLLAVVPLPDAVAIVAAPSEVAGRARLQPAPRCPVFTISADGLQAALRDGLGQHLWALLSWRMATSGLHGLRVDAARLAAGHPSSPVGSPVP